MRVQVKLGAYDVKSDDALLIPLFEKQNLPKDLPKFAQELLEDIISKKEFSGKARQIVGILLPTNKSQNLRHVFLVGLGKKEDLKMKDLGQLVGQVVRGVKNAKAKQLGVMITKELANSVDDKKNLAETMAEYAVLADYDFSEYLKKKHPSLRAFTIYNEDRSLEKDLKEGAKSGHLSASFVNESRDLANHPSIIATPTYLADFVEERGESEGINVTVLNERDMEKRGMGAILGVSRGSSQEAKFIIMEYWGAESKDEKPYVIVGKGVTFDTGGISLKPSNYMEEMKFDMCGGAAAIGIVRTAAAMKLPINVIGLVPASENMPGANAIKPSDVIQAMDGSTIEVNNTDAEGRLLLSDALVYARDYKPEAVIDLATLTGACVVALHDYASGLFTKDSEIADGLVEAGEDTGDLAWPMPLPDEYNELMKSSVADISNISSVKYGGAITAAVFLKHFVADKYPWAHLDIAGTAWAKGGTKYLAPGATGSGVRLVVQWLRNIAQSK